MAATATESRPRDRFSMWALPVCITTAFAAIHLWWLHHDTTALYWDMGRHGLNCLRVFDHFTQSGLPLVSRLSAFSEGPDPYYPPLYYWLSTLSIALFGRSADSIAYTGLLFAAIFNIAAFRIAHRLAGMLSGTIACLVASSIPILFDFTHQVMLDFPLTAMVALTLWRLYERPFDSFSRALGLGLALALGFLTKWTFPAFVGLPCLLVFLESLITRQAGSGKLAVRWKSVFSAALAAVVALALTLPWLLLHRRHLLSVSEAQTHVPGLTGWNGSQTAALLAGHFRALFENQMDLPSVVFLGMAVSVALASARWRKRTAPLLLTLASSVLAWGVLGKHQDVRYSMPQLAAVPPLIALFPTIIGEGRLAWSRPPLQAAVFMGCIFAVINMSFAPSLFNQGVLQRWRIAPQFAFHAGPPKHTPSEEPLRSIFETISASGRNPVVHFLDRNPEVTGLDGWSAAFYAEQFRVRLSGWHPSFTLLPVTDGPPTGKGRWFPVPGDEQKGIWVTEHEQPWEKGARKEAGFVLQARIPLDAEKRFSIVEHGGKGDGAMLVLENGREIAGVLLHADTDERFAVRSPPGVATELEVWGPSAVSVQVRVADTETLRGVDLGVDVGMDYPVNGDYAADHLLYSPNPSRKAPGIFLVGPYLSLPPGRYRASLHWSSLQPLSPQQTIELRVALGSRARVPPVRADASTEITSSEDGFLDAPFETHRVIRRAEFIVATTGFDARQVEARGMTLWAHGADLAERFLAYNGESHRHWSIFRLSDSRSVKSPPGALQ